MYASDFDDVLPRHDNNGSCIYGQSPCSTPDWGDFTFPAGGTSRTGLNVMFFGALQPYIKNVDVSICPGMGRTNWSSAFATAASSGIVPPAGGYVKADEDYYYNTMGQMAINMLAIDYGPEASATNNRAGAPKGRLGMVARPAEVFMFAAESSWDWSSSVGSNLGNGAVWPSFPDTNCWSSTSEGWTRYVHKGKSGTYSGATDARVTANPNYQGFATFAFMDGHAKVQKYLQAEQCVPVPGGGTWRGFANYYPKWVPEL